MMQTALRHLYPAHCMTCNAVLETRAALCGACWQKTPFIRGLTCGSCGVPLPGEEVGDDVVQCDECMTNARPWGAARAALVYKDNGRKLVLALKHGDRTDLAKPLADWMAQAATPLLTNRTLIAPVPLHWTRLVRRRYNQSALLAQYMADALGKPYCSDLLIRPKRTLSLDGKTRDERFATLQSAINANPRRRIQMAGRDILLVDDVMTSGATLAACAEACFSVGAAHVSVVVLARVAKDA